VNRLPLADLFRHLSINISIFFVPSFIKNLLLERKNDVSEVNKKQSSVFEKFLFKFTRLFALVGAACALMAGAVLLFNLSGSGDKDKYVSFNDLRPVQQTEGVGNEYAPTHPINKIKFPENVKKYLSGKNEKILNGWIEPLDEKNMKDFIKNLSSIIAEAEERNENVVNIINEYKIVKLEKLNETEFEKYEKVVSKAAISGTIFGLFIFIALMSLVLVMLAIERNTREIALN
jgi:hypothetical protein